jgi:4,5-DOPA dioxygenase extradiol
MPVLFVGHGSPMNAIEDNVWSRGFRKLGGLVPEPKAILSISAHWYVAGTFVTGDEKPQTIHDFGGFPQELYEIRYPAPGDLALAKRAQKLTGAALSTDWGLDHGTWSVLVHLRPKADLPVVQLSIDGRLRPARHVELGRALQPLREEGVLILGSGNVTHNLRHAFTAWHRGDTSTPAWAARFDEEVQKAAQQRDLAGLANLTGTEHGRLSHPTPDHYYPLLYAAGAAGESGEVEFPITGFDMGSLSMRSILFE